MTDSKNIPLADSLRSIHVQMERLGYLEAAAELRAVETSYRQQYDALEDLVWMHKRDDEDYNDVFERIGQRFYKECGMLRPGKSQPDEMMGEPSDEKRKETFNAWIACFRTRAVNALDIARGSHD